MNKLLTIEEFEAKASASLTKAADDMNLNNRQRDELSSLASVWVGAIIDAGKARA